MEYTFDDDVNYESSGILAGTTGSSTDTFVDQARDDGTAYDNAPAANNVASQAPRAPGGYLDMFLSGLRDLATGAVATRRAVDIIDDAIDPPRPGSAPRTPAAGGGVPSSAPIGGGAVAPARDQFMQSLLIGGLVYFVTKGE